MTHSNYVLFHVHELSDTLKISYTHYFSLVNIFINIPTK